MKAVDGDAGLNARVEYYTLMSQPRPRPPVSVNSSGAVLVTGRVDFESANTYTLTVVAVDLGSPPQNSTCRVTVEVVDSNDHTPIITFPTGDNPSVTIPLHTAPGSEVARVVAYDLDSGVNGELRYSISMANVTSIFHIDETSGVITLGDRNLPQDVRSYNVVVSVRDNGVPQRAQQALLTIEVVTAGTVKRSVNSMTLVIALISVTLVLALAVFATLLLIRCFDRRRSATEKHRHEILTKTGYHADPADKEPSGPLRTATVFTSSRQDTSLSYSPSHDLGRDTGPRYVSGKDLLNRSAGCTYVSERDVGRGRECSPLNSLEREYSNKSGSLERGVIMPERSSSPLYTSQQEISGSRASSPAYPSEKAYRSASPIHTLEQAFTSRKGSYSPQHAQEFSPKREAQPVSIVRRDASANDMAPFSGHGPQKDPGSQQRGAAVRGKKKTVSFERDLPPSLSEERVDEVPGKQGVAPEPGTVPVQVEGEPLNNPSGFSTFKPTFRPVGPFEEQQVCGHIF